MIFSGILCLFNCCLLIHDSLVHFLAVVAQNGPLDRPVSPFAQQQGLRCQVLQRIDVAAGTFVQGKVLGLVHPVRGESRIQRNATGEVATMAWPNKWQT